MFFVSQQTPEEELCNLLTNIVFSVLWSGSGAEGPEDVVWRERGQVFSVLTKLGSSCQLVRPPDDIKRRSVSVRVSHQRTKTLTWQTANDQWHVRQYCLKWTCVTVEKWIGPHLQAVSKQVLGSEKWLSRTVVKFQFAGDDAGVVSVRPEGRTGSVSAFLSQPGATPQAAAGLPLCWGHRQQRSVEWKGTSHIPHKHIMDHYDIY